MVPCFYGSRATARHLPGESEPRMFELRPFFSTKRICREVNIIEPCEESRVADPKKPKGPVGIHDRLEKVKKKKKKKGRVETAFRF